MPRNYIKKPKKYSDDSVKAALDDIEKNGISLEVASKKYGVEKTYLFRKTKNIHQGIQGRSTALSAIDELSLSENLKIMAKWGFPLSKTEVKNVVSEFVEQNNLKTAFGKKGPGDHWFTSFCGRHNLSLKKPETLEAIRRKATSDPYIIYNFYDLLESEINSLELAEKPHNIWNLDETAFNLDPSRIKAVSEKGKKLHRNIQGSGRENISVLACVSAAGNLLPPLIVFQAAKLWTSWKGENDLPNTFYSCSEKGWMTAEIFQNFFYKFCEMIKERPLILVFDGHLSHLDVGTLLKAKEENITILKLPPHTTDLLQPLDKSCFRPLKLTWDKELISWQRENQRKLNKNEFVNLLCKIWHQGITRNSIIRGFSSTGIYPVNRDAYPTDRLDSQKLLKYNEENLQKPKTSENPDMKLNEQTIHEEVPAEFQPVPGCSKDNQSELDLESGVSTPCSTRSSVSFEDLLLTKIKKTAPSNKKRRKINPFGKVVTSEEYLNEIKQKEQKELPKKSRKKKKCVEPTDSETSEDNVEVMSDSDSLVDVDIIGNKENEVELQDVENMKIGDYVLVNFKGGNRNASLYKYACIILEITKTEVQIQGLKSIDGNKQEFRVVENDISYVNKKDITALLPFPEIVRTGSDRYKYVFSNSVPVCEKI